MDKSLTSKWDGLSPHLVSSWYEVDRDGKRIKDSNGNDGPVVKCPLTECNLDMTQNWQSPFENIAQSNLPTLQQLIQSGGASTMAKIIDDKLDTTFNKLVSSVTGKSSITQLNSTQVWSGSPPLKISCTVVFRAWSDSLNEVEEPVNQLMRWALPKYLEPDGLISGVIKNGTDASLMPSTVPAIIAFKYKNRTYSPMVIESIGVPLSSPVDKNGRFVELSLPITLCGLYSIDRGNWDGYSDKRS